MKFPPKTPRITRRDVLVAVLSVLGTLLISSSSFTINKIIETKWFSRLKTELTLQDSQDYFPIAEGNTWVYSGEVEGQTSRGGAQVTKKKFDDYTITITQVIAKKGIHAALVKESYYLPDLLEGEREEQKELWILIGGKLFIITNQEKINDYLKELQSDSPSLVDFGQYYLEWEFPLFVGKKYTFLDSIIGGGETYAYKITKKSNLSMPGSGGERECFKREYLSVPDESYTWFCPGFGVIEHGYTHHGTVLNIKYRLEDYHVRRGS